VNHYGIAHTGNIEVLPYAHHLHSQYNQYFTQRLEKEDRKHWIDKAQHHQLLVYRYSQTIYEGYTHAHSQLFTHKITVNPIVS